MEDCSIYKDYKPISQSWATGQSNLPYKRPATTEASKFWFSYSHNCTVANGAFCLPSLIVQWPARFSHFYLLRMIVKLAYSRLVGIVSLTCLKSNQPPNASAIPISELVPTNAHLVSDMLWCVYDKEHMSALRLKNTSESDPRSYVVYK